MRPTFHARKPLKVSVKKMGYSSLDYILSGGEDYELLFTLKKEDAKKTKRLFLKAHTPVSLIGEVTSSPGKIILERESGGRRNLKSSAGFNHFKGDHRNDGGTRTCQSDNSREVLEHEY